MSATLDEMNPHVITRGANLLLNGSIIARTRYGPNQRIFGPKNRDHFSADVPLFAVSFVEESHRRVRPLRINCFPVTVKFKGGRLVRIRNVAMVTQPCYLDKNRW